MNTLIDSTLSAELQELYLENKEWLSDVLFLEDEMRFFRNLFDQVLSGNLKRENLQQIEMISSNLNVILERRKQLKTILKLRQHQLAQLLAGDAVAIGIELIEADAAIKIEIKSLIAGQRLLKNELFILAEKQKPDHKPLVTSRVLKIHAISSFGLV